MDKKVNNVKVNNNYRPLPKGLIGGLSKGLRNGIFTLCKWNKDTYIGVTHIKVSEETLELSKDGFLRTPLGGFIKHSTTPNSELITKENVLHMYTLRVIEAGEELTIDYTKVDCGQKPEDI